LGIEIAEFQHILQAMLDFRYRNRNFASDKFSTTALRFMVKKNAGTGKHAIAFTVIFSDPMTVGLETP
jgi:hypothetical protein